MSFNHMWSLTYSAMTRTKDNKYTKLHLFYDSQQKAKQGGSNILVLKLYNHEIIPFCA